MVGMPPGLVSPAAFPFASPRAPGDPSIPILAPPPSPTTPPGFQSPGMFGVSQHAPDTPLTPVTPWSTSYEAGTAGNQPGAELAGGVWLIDGPNGNVVYSSAQAKTGQLSMLCTGSTSGDQGLIGYRFSSGYVAQNVYFRAYLYVPNKPFGGDCILARCLSSNFVDVGFLGMNAAGQFIAGHEQSSYMVLHTFNNSVPLGQWIRIEMCCQAGSTVSTNVVTYRLYLIGPDSTTITESWTTTDTGTAADVRWFLAGLNLKAGNTSPVSVYTDDHAIDNNWIGPSGPATTLATKTAVSLWNVRQAISLTPQVAWNDRQLVSKTATLYWNDRQLVAKTASIQWNDRQAISKTASSTWNDRQLISKTASSTWNVAQRIAKTASVQWNVAQRIARTATISWTDLVSTNKTATIRWNDLIGPITKTAQATWNDRQLIKVTGSASWNVRAIQTKTASILWNDRNSVTITRQIVWNDRLQIVIQRGVTWNVRALVARTGAVRWNVYQLSGPVTKQLAWNDLNSVVKQAQVRWNDRQLIPKTANINWNAAQTLHLLLQILWNAGQSLPNPDIPLITPNFKVFARDAGRRSITNPISDETINPVIGE